MKLTFLKIDAIIENQDCKIIKIPDGGIVFQHKTETISLAEPIEIKMTHCGNFKNIVRYVPFALYTDQSLNVVQLTRASLFSIVAHDDIQRAIYSEIAKRCKVVPFYKPLDERELFAMEYENACGQLVGV